MSNAIPIRTPNEGQTETIHNICTQFVDSYYPAGQALLKFINSQTGSLRTVNGQEGPQSHYATVIEIENSFRLREV